MRIAKLVTLGLVLVAAACVKRVEERPARTMGAGLVLEQFLTAANSNDLRQMGNLFGNKDGPVSKRDNQDNVEKRMFVLANVLRHDDYKLEGEQIVPGRLAEAIQLQVTLTSGTRKVTVPFTMVRSKADQWLVEDFDMTKILNQR
jgi:hypothetical protein